MQVDRQLSHQGSSSRVHPKDQGFVTEKAFNDKLGKIEKALQTLLNRQGSEKSASEEQKSTETVSPPQAVMGDRSGSTPSVMEVPRGRRGCTFKDFAAFKPPVFKGERDDVLAL
jgi:hypothetical protein